MQIGIIGLGRMGANIGRRLMKAGHKVVGFDRDPKAIAALNGADAAADLADMIKKLSPPRAVWVMLPAGRITEDAILQLGDLLSPGDTVIDGGNTFYKDDIRRAKILKDKHITYVDCGTSGGVWGLERGYCMMIGGDKAAVDRLDPIFAALAPGEGVIDKTPGREKMDPRVVKGYMHAGPAGAGHFVKMVHNGIEYGLMQAYAEGFDILRGKSGTELPEDERFDIDLADVAEVWRRGSVVSSWLLDLTAIALAKSPGLDGFSGSVDDSGEGRWTINAAIEEAVPAPVITAALYTRFRSRIEHSFGEKLLSAMRNEFGGHVETHPPPTPDGKTGEDQMTVLSHKQPPPPTAIVIFGANGDLTKRLVVPALYNLARTGMLPPRFVLVGVDHNDKTSEEWQAGLKSFLADTLSKNGESVDDKLWQPIASSMTFLKGDFEDDDAYQKLSGLLTELDKKEQLDGNVLFYMAVADRFFATIAGKLGKAGLSQQKDKSFRRLIVEKPFGHDLASAKALNKCLLQYFEEEQIYRIDHFLGKETVQNIMALRFANGLFEPIWNRDRIDHVQITVAESIGIEGRGNFYEKTGALRDMLPNHLFQLVAMVAMEPPVSFDAEDIRAKKAEMFKAVHPLGLADVVRGQYDAGTIAGQAVPAYRAEKDVAPDSNIETFAAARLLIDNWRWAGVPFYLRTGKRLSTRSTEIAIRFKRAPFALFRETPQDELDADWLILRVQPDEGIKLRFNAKRPGPAMALESVAMEFKYKDWFKQAPAVGYETLIYDCLIGDTTLFQRADQVESAWSVVEPVLRGWENVAPRHFPNYAAGSEGPIAANDLLARDGRSWRGIK